MRKVVMLSAAAILGIASIAVSQAESAIDTPVTISAVAEGKEVVENAPQKLGDEPQAAADTTDGAASADATAQADATATDAPAEATAAAAPAAVEEPIPQDTPQVQKLIALYPNLIARIQPVAKICFEEDEVCDVTARSAGPAAGDGPRDGKAVYNAVCQTCHASGLLGSPKLGDAGAWGPRIAKGKDTLYTHAINGFNAMPAKGGADIPDEEVQNAVDYMVGEAS
ncbi:MULTISPECIES: c-type cytochrome [Psychrobacter]|uniref:Cytochrome c, class I n=1 Tax=Psychrobacter cryohalolentis (strain ATCC BAA-1226 / DSM 17306 / VKM B-2378 / K5) TaxID=335284 RepID=Q1QDL1_PSYCK|nr:MULTISPECIES: c-type cytochrome [Psychrobacter]ABE74242.1 cytochrome c, class I [Psychrobacter cryohalolentis K5]|tara:strand:+ start:1756 stop:2433 length:678 start_codon:yes stop_codon:yes gene_type:complete